MRRTSGRARAIYTLKWDANQAETCSIAHPSGCTDSTRTALTRGTWAAFLGESKSTRWRGYRKEIWYGQVLHVRRGEYKVRYALKRPTSLNHVESTCYTAPASSVIERVGDISSCMQWRFSNPLEMLIAAAECVLP
jgi:hypothetical protein